MAVPARLERITLGGYPRTHGAVIPVCFKPESILRKLLFGAGLDSG